MNAPRPFWNPYVAGVALGLVALASFVVTGRGLGASGAFKHAEAAIIHHGDPTWAEENQNIGPLFQPGRSVMNDWIEAFQACDGEGKRLCLASEWNLAMR